MRVCITVLLSPSEKNNFNWHFLTFRISFTSETFLAEEAAAQNRTPRISIKTQTSV